MDTTQPMTEEALAQAIRRLAKEKNALILAHYYTEGAVQDVADFVGDSLALAQHAAQTPADTIVMCGVHFMAETCKILCPQKTVLTPDPTATCSLAESCPATDFEAFVKAHPEHKVVSYVNTSAAVKALSDIVVTSSNARRIVESFPADQPLIFGPDRHLGAYINSITGRRMLLWDGACHVHSRFSLTALIALKKEHPEAKVLVHPECPAPFIQMADTVGSTAALLRSAVESTAQEFIVVTESGILHEMQAKAPHKTFIPVPPETADDSAEGAASQGRSAHGCSCNECGYMRLITLRKVYDSLALGRTAVEVAPAVAEKALIPIRRMLELSR